MIVREIIVTCSNPHVARAAVASIGGEFARRFAARAAGRGLSSGLYAARLVRAFAREANDQDWEGVDEATHGVDQPILSGLRALLERALDFGVAAPRVVAGTPPAWAIAAVRASACRG